MLTAWFVAAAAGGFAGLVLAGPPRARDLYALPALGTCALILLLAVLGAALVH
ncbi:hypothetical protein [Streptomyces subrutilus]|uniref:hypothetical protein n=1 Tax=Streptomyces subrutilus TaxID=36818 RepID=UPI002E0ED855|nr:hypothetical protein OG479_29545 [Streptomyces subrutilus]